ncbi:MAG: dienelactone hydrolase family protein [Ilumatobacteraceae bacterium]
MRVTAADGHEFEVFDADPGGAGATIVVVQEIFGVNPHIRSVVERFAALGYRAVAPALFDRVESGVELDYDGDGVVAGRALADRIKWEPAMLDIGATVDEVTGTGAVGVVGFCFGGSLAWRSAHELPIDAAVGYYGGQVGEMIDLRPHVPTMLHFGELDHAIPLDDVAGIAAAHPSVPVHVYAGAQHGFHCDARGSFDPVSAAIAFGRTVEFLVAAGVRP